MLLLLVLLSLLLLERDYLFKSGAKNRLDSTRCGRIFLFTVVSKVAQVLIVCRL
jgi:hypothetical protein